MRPAAGTSTPSEPFDGAIDIASMDCAKIMEFVFISRYHRRWESQKESATPCQRVLGSKSLKSESGLFR